MGHGGQLGPVHEDYRLVLLGRPTLRRGDQEVALAPSWQRLLGLIAIVGATSRPRLCGTLWPEATDSRAQGDLRTCLWRVNRACPGLLSMSGPQVELRPSVFCDVRHVESVARGVLRGDAGTLHADVVSAALRGSGQLMPGSTDMWVLLERESLRQLKMHALETWSDYLIGRGLPGQALEAAYAAVECEPLRESAHRAVIRALIAANDTDSARRHCAVTVRYLRGELGVAPSSLLTALARELSGMRD